MKPLEVQSLNFDHQENLGYSELRVDIFCNIQELRRGYHFLYSWDFQFFELWNPCSEGMEQVV